MEGRSPEFALEKPETTEKGFSEKRAARIIEGKQKDNSQLKKRKPLILPKQKTAKRDARLTSLLKKTAKRDSRFNASHSSMKEKILAAYEKNAQEIQNLMKNFNLLSRSSFAASELMTEMRARQQLQEELLNALALAGQDNQLEDSLPKELADLIK